MESLDYHSARALLDWQIELGADECIADTPTDCYSLPDKAAPVRQPATPAHLTKGPVKMAARDPVAEAQAAAAAAPTLDALRTALEAFDLFEFRRGARNMLFGDGTASAPVMIVGDVPDRDEDRAGKPFVGAAGALLDRMFAAIDMGRDHAQRPLYLTSTLPWMIRDRDPKPEELAMIKPFLLRHITLAAPKAVVLMGNGPCQALLAKRGIARLRGTWTEVAGIPALPMCPPQYLLRTPEAKRDAWADLLSLRAAVAK